jgi:hypothetical protein
VGRRYLPTHPMATRPRGPNGCPDGDREWHGRCFHGTKDSHDRERLPERLKGGKSLVGIHAARA